MAQHLDLVSKRLRFLLEYRRLMEGAVKPKLEEADFSTFITKDSGLIMMFFSGGKSSRLILRLKRFNNED